MSLDEVPVIVSAITVEESSFVIDVTETAPLSAVDVTVEDPVSAVDVTTGETVAAIDVTIGELLSAVDVTIGDPAATVIVDIPGSGGDEVIGGKITIGPTAPASPGVNDAWVNTS